MLVAVACVRAAGTSPSVPLSDWRPKGLDVYLTEVALGYYVLEVTALRREPSALPDS